MQDDLQSASITECESLPFAIDCCCLFSINTHLLHTRNQQQCFALANRKPVRRCFELDRNPRAKLMVRVRTSEVFQTSACFRWEAPPTCFEPQAIDRLLLPEDQKTCDRWPYVNAWDLGEIGSREVCSWAVVETTKRRVGGQTAVNVSINSCRMFFRINLKQNCRELAVVFDQ